MGAFDPYKKIDPVLLHFKDEEWKKILEKDCTERDHYQITEQTFQFGRLAARFLGVPRDEDEYYLTLFHVASKPSIHRWNGRLIKEFDSGKFQALQEVLMIHQNEQLSVNRFIAFLEGKQLIPSYDDAALHRHIRESVKEVLSAFAGHHPEGLGHPDSRRVITDLVKWLWNHADGLLRDWDGKSVPAVLWYGDATKSERYFLYFILLAGFDMLIFHPAGTDIFAELDPEGKAMAVQRYPDTREPRPFPEKRPDRKATVAYRASKEIEQILHDEQSPIFKPWQYRSHRPVSLTLKTTFDELFLMSRERAFIRPNFFVEGNEVHIPSLFAKVSGVTASENEYWEKIEELKSGDLSYFIHTYPIREPVKGNFQYHYQHALGPDGTLDLEKMMNSVWWRLKQLPLGVQEAVAAGISRVCASPKLKPEPHESPEDTKLFLFTQLTSLPKPFLALLVKFDYPQYVPRAVLYNSGTKGTFDRADAALLLLLKELGFDIILFNPSGLRDIELYIDEKYYDVHLMEHFEFELEYQEPKVPIWRRIFKK
ncbi:YceG family protein [Bacillus massiliglaciei]|uniref:YceG family protein n=1 Tax=Bacillus massiliglaciei TaxID=1816693 RepID=UPI0018FE71C5|nr:YceG family protein [Bacillus massiliglaciei]